MAFKLTFLQVVSLRVFLFLKFWKRTVVTHVVIHVLGDRQLLAMQLGNLTVGKSGTKK